MGGVVGIRIALSSGGKGGIGEGKFLLAVVTLLVILLASKSA